MNWEQSLNMFKLPLKNSKGTLKIFNLTLGWSKGTLEVELHRPSATSTLPWT